MTLGRSDERGLRFRAGFLLGKAGQVLTHSIKVLKINDPFHFIGQQEDLEFFFSAFHGLDCYQPDSSHCLHNNECFLLK